MEALLDHARQIRTLPVQEPRHHHARERQPTGNDSTECRPIANQPWNSSAIFASPDGWRRSRLPCRTPRRARRSRRTASGRSQSQPMITEGIASRTSGSVMTHGVSCGFCRGDHGHDRHRHAHVSVIVVTMCVMRMRAASIAIGRPDASDLAEALLAVEHQEVHAERIERRDEHAATTEKYAKPEPADVRRLHRIDDLSFE
jgi:hypothetical protein